MDTDDVLAFTTAVSAGSLAAAARRLGVQPMAVTRRLAALEASLGVRLLHRTTRSLSLTPEGETFMPFAEALVENEREALARLATDGRGAAGLLRVSVSVAFGRKVVAPIVPRLLERNPELRVALDLTDSLPDLVATGTDLAIRIAGLRDSGLIAQRLADNPRLIAASPDYLARHGLPQSIADLSRFDCLALAGATHWTFRDGAEESHVRLDARFLSSSIEGCHAACLAGGGLALLSEWNAADDLASGRLVRVCLGSARPEPIAIWAVYPTRKLLLPKVRVFIAELRAVLDAAGLRDEAGRSREAETAPT